MSSKRLEMLEKMTASGKADSFAWYGLAMEYRSLGRNDDALRTFETLRGNDPGYVAQYLMAAQLLQKLGRAADAKEWIAAGLDAARKKGDAHAAKELEGLLVELGGLAAFAQTTGDFG